MSNARKGRERHIICGYVDDYTDLEQVNGLRKVLKEIRGDRRIGFRPDAYTHLGIYVENQAIPLSRMNPPLPTSKDFSLHFYDLCLHEFFFLRLIL